MSNTSDHKRFCENDGWELYKQTDHYFFKKQRADGSWKFTKVSMGCKEYGEAFWQIIMKKKLECEQGYFNSKK